MDLAAVAALDSTPTLNYPHLDEDHSRPALALAEAYFDSCYTSVGIYSDTKFHSPSFLVMGLRPYPCYANIQKTNHLRAYRSAIEFDW